MKLLLTVLLLASVAHADPTAASLYSEGEAQFRAGKMEDAVESFSRGYALEPRPEFLLNLAQCYRALGRRSDAILYLERFIQAAPDHALRPNAERTLGELRRADALERIALTPRPPPPPPPTKRSNTWLWVTLGAVAVAGAGAGVFFATRGPTIDDTIRLPP